MNSKWIRDLNISLGTIKILEENKGTEISHILCSDIFANIPSRAREIKENK